MSNIRKLLSGRPSNRHFTPRKSPASWRLFQLPTWLLLSALMVTQIISPTTQAQKLYKVIDSKGNVSYQDYPPVDENSVVEEQQLDLGANSANRPEQEGNKEAEDQDREDNPEYEEASDEESEERDSPENDEPV